MLLPVETVERIEPLERNRRRFILEPVELERIRRRRAGPLRSLDNPHPKAVELAEMGLAGCAAQVCPKTTRARQHQRRKAVRWVEGQGWVEEPP